MVGEHPDEQPMWNVVALRKLLLCGQINNICSGYHILLLLFWEQKREVKVKLLSCVQLFATPWTVAHQASPSMGFSRQEYWSGLPFP